jgi:WD40 repeat protein
VSTRFNFPGTGKAVTFTSNDHFVLLTSKGIGKYHMDSLTSSYFHNDDRINAFAIGKSGRFYLACNNLIKIYRCWENILEDSFSVALKLNSKVSSLAVDNTEQYFAAGTYEGFVCIINLRNNNIMWNKAIHLSNVNDLKFQYLDDDFLQLASAGADKTIKLIDVEEIRRENNQEVITLNGHTKWVYGVDYTPDGKWLVSTGEDNKVIVWKPTMDDLYKVLHN